MRLTNEYIGSAKITPNGDVVAGSISTWEIVYTVGKYGIDDGGHLRLQWRSVSDWEVPQFTSPKAQGYSTITTNGNAKLKYEYSVYERPFNNGILISVYDGFLKEGDIIKFVMGDKSQGSIGIKAQSFCEDEHEIKVLPDPFGTNRYEELPERLKFKIVAGPYSQSFVTAPGSIEPNKPFQITIKNLDEYGNLCTSFEGDVKLSIPLLSDTEYELPKTVTFTKADNGRKVITALVKKEGNFSIMVQCDKSTGFTLSNGFSCKSSEKYNLYWGDMHAQTALTVGTGSLDSYFTFARDVGCVDFTGWQGNDFEVDDDKWLHVREKAKEYTKENEFLVYLGYEWSGTTPSGGDHNVFFLGDSEEFYPSSNWSSKGKPVNSDLNANPISQLWDRCHGRNDMLVIPHIGGRYANLDYYNPKFIPAIEIHSHHGTFEWFAFEAMKRRLKVGFVAASDDHTCRPGLSYPLAGNRKGAASSFDVSSGFVGVYAESKTKQSIWNAIKSRRCYASTFGRTSLNVKIDEHYMGEEISMSSSPVLSIESVASAPIDTVHIYNWDKLISEHSMLKKDKKKIRIAWSGVLCKTRQKSTDWTGSIYIENGRIISADEISFDRADQGIKSISNTSIEWVSSTSGDIDGIILELDGNENTIIHFSSAPKSFDIKLSDIKKEATIFEAGGENLKVEVLYENMPLSGDEYFKACSINLSEQMPPISDNENAYWVKVTMTDGHMAWSSPIFVNKKN